MFTSLPVMSCFAAKYTLLYNCCKQHHDNTYNMIISTSNKYSSKDNYFNLMNNTLFRSNKFGCIKLPNLRRIFKGELRSEISLLHMKVLTLIKAKSNVFLWYVQCCSCTQRSKTKILTTRAPPSWTEFDVVMSQRQTQSASDCVMLLESITWDSQMIFLAFTRDQ